MQHTVYEEMYARRDTERSVYVTDNYTHSPLCLLVNESQLRVEHKVSLCVFPDFVSVHSYLVIKLDAVTLFHTLTDTVEFGLVFLKWSFCGSSSNNRRLIVIEGGKH